MISTLLTLAVLAKGHDKPLLEPAPPAEFKRLQPRSITATSILRDSFNRFEQNYLPVYVADDAPDTAWVEGVKGQGEGESLTWVGPPLQKAKALKVFIRNGLQASKVLFEANSRAKKIRLEPVGPNPDGAGFRPAGAPLEIELKSVLGWQEIDVPVESRFSALRLTLLSTYKGKRYEDTCISDLRVYVNGDDPYKEELETKALENLKAFIASRAALKPQLAAAYEGKKIGELPEGACKGVSDCLEKLSEVAGLKAITARAQSVFDKVDDGDAATDSKAWHYVSGTFGQEQQQLAPVFSSLANRETSPSKLLERRNVKVTFRRAPNELKDNDYYGVPMVKGAADKPSAVLVRETLMIDGRESISYNAGPVYAVTYAGDLAEGVVDYPSEFGTGAIYLVTWTAPKDGPPALASVVSIDFGAAAVVYEWKVKG